MAETVMGVDVSSHQGAIDWARVRESNVGFAILRAGYGKYHTQADKRFAENYAACHRLGIPVGAYWYSYAVSIADAEAEADAAMEILRGKQFAYPIFFDIEDKVQLALSKTIVQEIAETFCHRLEANNYFVGIYSYKTFLEQNFSERILRRYAVWVAQTGVPQTNYRYPYGIWQYSHTGSVSGIRGAVDLDAAVTDYPAIIRAAEKNGFVPQNCPYAEPHRPVRYGDSGEAVRWMQCRLAVHGFPCGISGVDGRFGPDTRAALLGFQHRNGLETDGVCGPLTRAKLAAAPQF